MLLHQPRGRLQQAPGLPLLAAAWGSHSSDAELQQGCDLLQWPLGFVGTAAGHGPLHQFHWISSKGRCSCVHRRVPLQGELSWSKPSKMQLQPQVPTCTLIYFYPIKSLLP